MAMRFAAARVLFVRRSMPARLFSDGKGKVLSEEERAAETIYIQKMERERAEKLKLKMEKEKSKEAEKKSDETHKG